jgi:hypothetical protein
VLAVDDDFGQFVSRNLQSFVVERVGGDLSRPIKPANGRGVN